MKWIYLASRSADVQRTDFARAWRQHARLADQFPDLARYFRSTLYCHLSAQEEARYDAAGLLELDGPAAIQAVLEHPDAIGTMHPDELSVFEDYIDRLSLAAQDHVLREGEFGSHVALVLLDAPGASAETVDRELQALLPREEIGRSVVNHVCPSIFPTRHTWTAVIELHGDEAAPCRAAGVVIADALSAIGETMSLDGPTVLRWRSSQ